MDHWRFGTVWFYHLGAGCATATIDRVLFEFIADEVAFEMLSNSVGFGGRNLDSQ